MKILFFILFLFSSISFGYLSPIIKASGVLPVANGGTDATGATAAFDTLSPLTTQGDVLYFNGTHNVRLGAGTVGACLATGGASANPSYKAVAMTAGTSERVERALVANPSGTASITAQSGSWLTSCTESATGKVGCVIATGEFSASPTCVANRDLTDTNATGVCVIDAYTSTSITVWCYNADQVSLQNDDFTLICMGPH